LEFVRIDRGGQQGRDLEPVSGYVLSNIAEEGFSGKDMQATGL
jgi:hypothetical protein